MPSLATRRVLAVLAPAMGVALAFGPATAPAQGQARLEAHYRATLGGMPIGSGAWVVNVAGDRYAMAASGQASGLLRAIAKGNGNAAVQGAINGVRVMPSNYIARINARRPSEVKMALAGGAVRALAVEPPVPPREDRVPVTEAHKRGIIDPVSAAIAPRPSANGIGPEVCRRTVPVFDGHMRFDLVLTFKRMETVQSETGYSGPVAVCMVRYRPVSGHQEARSVIQYLRENRDIEVWFAPIAGTRFVAMYRAVVPTVLGPGVLQATRFVTAAREGPAAASAGRLP